MTTKYTPGPWHVESPALSIADSQRIEVATVRTYGDDAEALANARLIAAAPELLEALIILHKIMDTARLSRDEWARVDAVLVKAGGKP